MQPGCSMFGLQALFTDEELARILRAAPVVSGIPGSCMKSMRAIVGGMGEALNIEGLNGCESFPEPWVRVQDIKQP